jgi:diguanylate cyclase (GGDEF)-like protein
VWPAGVDDCLVRAWFLVLVSVLAVAGALLYSSEVQRNAAEVNFREAITSEALLSDFLDQERSLDTLVTTGRRDVEVRYFTAGRLVDANLHTAATISRDDAREAAAVAGQQAARQSWLTLAARALEDAHAGRHADTANVTERDVALDRFTEQNSAYQARLAVVRTEEQHRVGLVPVWIIRVLGGLFVAAALALWVRARRRNATAAADQEAARTREEAFVGSQARFSEALQVAEDQGEAHRLLRGHLEGSIAGSSVLVLKRNNSGDRLEPTLPLAEEDPLREPLEHAQPRSCLAVRLSRRYDRSDTADEILECEICGKLPNASTCSPLLVGGEVIGSVLVSSDGAPGADQCRRIEDSVTQAAPVLANLRNLAIAETRAATDALTGLPNKRAMDETIKRMAAESGRTGLPLSIVALDLDHFKRINDTYGHDRGDEVLAAVSAALRGEIRASDLAARMGGEEFLIALPDTDRPGALQAAEKLRRALHGIKVRGLDWPITASMGVATLPGDAGDIDALLRIADRALYAAKRGGRDRIESPSGRLDATDGPALALPLPVAPDTIIGA